MLTTMVQRLPSRDQFVLTLKKPFGMERRNGRIPKIGTANNMVMMINFVLFHILYYTNPVYLLSSFWSRFLDVVPGSLFQ